MKPSLIIYSTLLLALQDSFLFTLVALLPVLIGVGFFLWLQELKA